MERPDLSPLVPADPDAERAIQIAQQVQAACDACLPTKRGFCRVATELMCVLLHEAGLSEAVCVSGDYDHPLSDEDGHSWVAWRQLILDARAEQFEPQAPLVVAADDCRYRPWTDEAGRPFHDQPSRAAVAETLACFYCWNAPEYAAPTVALASRLGFALADWEPHLDGELDLSWPDDALRQSAWAAGVAVQRQELEPAPARAL